MKKEMDCDYVIAVPELKKRQVQIPSKIIPLNKATTYYNNFYQTRLANYTQNSLRAVWFDYKALKDYFKYVTNFCSDKQIKISRFSFLLGANKNNQRTIFIAPVTYDEQLDLHRAFSFDNNKITYLHRFAGEPYSTVKDFDKLQSVEQSLILHNSHSISSAEAITLYNNYHDAITAPFSAIVELDTRFVYYEVGEFEEYLSFLDDQAALNNISLSGINVVFAAHQNNEDAGIYANHLTLFFAPTLKENRNCSFFSFDKPNENILDFSKNTLNPQPIKILSSQLSTLFNFGQGGPPPVHWD
jgi:hypothetical protein